MDQIMVENFRCFRERQTARMAPLTLLVGENSTGKTSFLALLRALWDVACSYRYPDFKEAPYDLGSFDEIVHHRGARADSFGMGFCYEHFIAEDDNPYYFEITFGKSATAPIPVRRFRSLGKVWIDEQHKIGQPFRFRVGTEQGVWEGELPPHSVARIDSQSDWIWPPVWLYRLASEGHLKVGETEFRLESMEGSPPMSSDDWESLRNLLEMSFSFVGDQAFASAPVRSKPKRTYDPTRPTPDPEGDYVPMYLANLFSQDDQQWTSIKEQLEAYGKAAGLFDEISIRRLGRRDSEPFQVQVRKFSGRLKGPYRNLIDVGYGVSQVLPIVTELLRDEVSPMYLLQQPEVHLHPSAQAALGSLFCQLAGPERQIVVETHSDHLMDRVRMDVRDGVAGLKPSDVSILYFERTGLEVKIHSLEIDEEGNILNAPDGYRSFFMEEVSRSLWKNYGRSGG